MDVTLVARAVLLVIAAALPVSCVARPPEEPPDSLADDDIDADTADREAWLASRRGAATSSDAELVWLSSEEEAVNRGLAERRPVLVHFEVDWCTDCKRMKSETFGDPRVKARAGRFVAVCIDATNDEDPRVSAALEKYAVVNVPTLILLDSSGRERRRFTELVGPETLLSEIERVR